LLVCLGEYPHLSVPIATVVLPAVYLVSVSMEDLPPETAIIGGSPRSSRGNRFPRRQLVCIRSTFICSGNIIVGIDCQPRRLREAAFVLLRGGRHCVRAVLNAVRPRTTFHVFAPA